MSLAGVVILGVAVGVNMKRGFGMDPFGAFVAGTGLLSGLSYGIMFMAVQAVLALLAFFLDKHYLHVSTVLQPAAGRAYRAGCARLHRPQFSDAAWRCG